MRSRFSFVVCSSFLLITVVTFWPGLTGGFVSDMFGFLGFAENSSFVDVLQKFTPVPHYYYRPLYFAIFWLLYPVFGDHPLLYLLLSFAGHLMSGFLLYQVSAQLGVRREAAALASLVFLLSLHAHEPILEVSQLHFSLGSAVFLGSILSYLKKQALLSFGLAAVTLLIFEAGLLILPLACLYELLFRLKEPGKLRRLVPVFLLTSVYLAFRHVGSDVFSERGGGCQSARCWIAGVAEYLNRLFVRPEAAVALIWGHRIAIGAAMFLAMLSPLALLRPWAWRHWPRLLFAFGWLAGSVLYFLIALWPYVSDRFLYIPDMGLALCVGVIAAEVIEGWGEASRGARMAAASVAGLFLVWLLAGAIMIHERAERWSQAAGVAQRIVDNIHALQPDLPVGATVCVSGLPDSLEPQIAPGNTGPYVFRNNFPAALYRRYGRRDFGVASECRTGFAFAVAPDGEVTQMSLPSGSVRERPR